jgi:molybdate transport system substrate-binding protein
MTKLKILSGGAAQGLVASLAAKFKQQTDFDIEGEFGAVGAMAGKLRAGTKADLVILSSALIDELARENLVIGGSISDLGLVETAIAVRAADPPVRVRDAASLKNVLLEADVIFVPDTRMSTAGIHVARVLEQLGIAETVATRLKIYPNGATAMSHLAESRAARPIGCTQATEIINTRGVKPSGSLPPGYDLSTLYTAAIATGATHRKQSQVLLDLLIGKEQQPLRTEAGFPEARNQLQ